MEAIEILKQRQATEKDIEIKRKVKLNLQKEQMEKLKAGQRPKFFTRRMCYLTFRFQSIVFLFIFIICQILGELKEKLMEEKLKSMNRREKERYLSRKANKFYEVDAFDG